MKTTSKIFCGICTVCAMIGLILEGDSIWINVIVFFGFAALAWFFYNPYRLFSIIYAAVKTAKLIIEIQKNDAWDQLDRRVRLADMYNMFLEDYEAEFEDWFGPWYN